MALFIVFLFGLAVGSFLNVLIDRLPKGESVLAGRSHCDFCKKTLRWFELIPLLSFILQQGHCRRCHKKLSLQYPLVELATGVGFIWIFLLFDNLTIGLFDYWIIGLLGYLIIFSSFLVIFVSDLKYQIIPDSMVVMGVIGVIGVIGFRVFIMNYEPSAINVLVSAFTTSLLFLLLWLVTRGRGMGFGDVKLVFLLGLLLGYPKIVVALYSAFLTGAALGIILILGRKKSLKSQISFGPFLILGTLIALAWGEKIINLWRNLL